MCDPVTHQPGSRFVAGFRGLVEALAEFTYDETPVTNASTIADQTIGPDGKPLSLDEPM